MENPLHWYLPLSLKCAHPRAHSSESRPRLVSTTARALKLESVLNLV